METIFLFVNATKLYEFKAKNSEIKDYVLCLDNVSKEFTVTNVKKQGQKESKVFSVGFDPTDDDDILDIYKYLMKRT